MEQFSVNYFQKLIKKISNTRILKYIFTGGMALVVEYLSFVLLLELLFIDHALMVAQSLSFCAGLITSFLGNRLLTFNDTNSRYIHSIGRQLYSYFALAIVNLLITNIIIYLLVNQQSMNPLVAKLAVMIAVAFWNYLVFKRFIFKASESI